MTRPDSSLRRLVRAAVQMANILAVRESAYTKSTEYLNRFTACVEALCEASIAYASALPDHDRERLAR